MTGVGVRRHAGANRKQRRQEAAKAPLHIQLAKECKALKEQLERRKNQEELAYVMGAESMRERAAQLVEQFYADHHLPLSAMAALAIDVRELPIDPLNDEAHDSRGSESDPTEI